MKSLLFSGVLLLATASAAVAASGAAQQARLGVLDQRPLVVRGTGFEANERVVVRVAAGRVWTRSVVARATGTFTVRFGMSLERCRSFTLRALGHLGSHARLYGGLRVDCVPRDNAIRAAPSSQE